MSACADQCPICKTRLADQCCETCGSLEGVDEDSFAASRVFGYDWAAGSVAPWRDASGRGCRVAVAVIVFVVVVVVVGVLSS